MKKKRLFIWVMIFISFLLFSLTYYFINTPSMETILVQNTSPLIITSTSFSDGGFIPKDSSCEWGDHFPSLTVSGLVNAQSLVLIVDDPDAPAGTWVHLVAYGIPVTGNEMTIDEALLKASKWGLNSFQSIVWRGPCPPKWHGIHHYHFKVYGLSSFFDPKSGLSKQTVLESIRHSILSYGELIGTYERK